MSGSWSDQPEVRPDYAGNCLWVGGAFLAAFMFLFALGLSGCVTPDQLYVEADRLTYEAVAPEYGAYLDADTKLSDKQKDRRHKTLESWKHRLDEAAE